MVKKLKFIFLLSFTIFSILGTNSFASITSIDKMNKETMQEIVNYMISKETTTSTKTTYKNIDLDNLVNHFNTTTATLLKSQDVEYIEQLIIYYEDYNDYLLLIPNNDTIGDILPFNKITYYANKNAYYLPYTSGIVEIKLKINSTTSFTSSNYNTAEINIGQLTIDYDNSKVTSTELCSIGNPASIQIKIANASEFEWFFLYPNIEIYGQITDNETDGENGEDTSGDAGGTTIPNYTQDLNNIKNEIGNVNNNLENLGNKIESGNKEVVNQIESVKDFLSGDTNITDNELLEKFPEVEIEDPSEDFFSWIFSQLENVFLSTEPQTFEFSLFTENKYTVSSEQIKVPENAIKTLIALSTSFGIFYWILKDVRKTINKVKEGSIEALATEDITADMV